jgi:hypothetical protein
VCADKAAYLDAGHYLFLASLILAFIPIIPGIITSNFYLDKRHNAVEAKEVIMRSEAETGDAAIRSKVAVVEEQARRDLARGAAH